MFLSHRNYSVISFFLDREGIFTVELWDLMKKSTEQLTWTTRLAQTN